MSVKGSWLKIQSYKHDGSLHRCWERNYVLLDDEAFFVTANHKTKVQRPMVEDGFQKNRRFLFLVNMIGLMLSA